MQIENLQPGTHYSNKDIYTTFLCGAQGGMRRSHRTNTLVLIVRHIYSIYNDRWNDGVLYFTGMGKKGNQVLNGNQNITLFESPNNGVEVHLFEEFNENTYTYKSRVQLADKPFIEKQDDFDGSPRDVWVFPLKVFEELDIDLDFDLEDYKLMMSSSIKKGQEQGYLTYSEIYKRHTWLHYLEPEELEEIFTVLKELDIVLVTIDPEEYKQILNTIITKGQEQGYLTYSEINEILPEELLATEEVEPIVTMLEELDIDVVEDVRQQFFDNYKFDDSNLDEVSNLPVSSLLELTVRSRNCLAYAKIETLGELLKISEYELTRIPNLGRKSLKEIKQSLSELKLSLDNNSLNEEYDLTIRPPKFSEIAIKPPKKAFDDFDHSNLEKYYDVPVSSLLEFSVRSSNCLAYAGIETFGELLKISQEALMRIPNFGKSSLNEIKQKLSQINFSLETNSPKKEFFEIDDSSLGAYIDSLKAHIGDRRFEVIAGRIGLNSNQPKTLEEIGKKLDVTRERIRQLEAKSKKYQAYINLIKLIDKKLYSARENLLLPLYLQHLPNYDSWFEILNTKPWILQALIDNHKDSSHLVEKIGNDQIITSGKNYSLLQLLTHLKNYLDNQIGKNFTKKDLKDHIKLLMPSMANEITDYLIVRLNKYKFTENSDDSQSYFVSSGIGILPSVKALLESYDRPLSIKEISEKLGYSKGFSRSYSNQMTENQNIFLYGRSLYGLKKHLGLTEAEINLVNLQINSHVLEHGPDKQWHCDEILKNANLIPEIKKKLNPYKMIICLTQSDEFKILGNMLFVLAGSSNISIVKKNFSQMVVDVLENSDEPLTTAQILSIIQKDRGLAKNPQIQKGGRLISIESVDNKKKHNKWALIDKHLNLTRNEIISCIEEMLYLIQQHDHILTPENANQVIKNNNVLKRFENNIYLLFSLCSRNINFIVKDHILYHVDANIPNMSQEICLKKIAAKINRKGMRKEELMKQAESLYGRPVSHNLTSRLYRFGFIYDKNEEIWYKGELISDW